jgi:hypothetical protein
VSETLDLTAEEFAMWLVERAPERLWGVDGEDQIEMTLSLPCTGTELAAELARRGGRLRFSGPTDAHTEPRRDLGRLSPVAYGQGDEIIFRAVWLNDGNTGREWFIVTDLLAEEATRSARAS